VVNGTTTRTVSTHVDEDGTIGFYAKTDFLPTSKTSYTFFQSVPAGISKSIETIRDYAKQLKVIFTVKDAHKQIGGFLTIGKAYSKVWDWQSFWAFTGFLSFMLAFMNILPIPALDGGHVMFLLYE